MIFTFESLISLDRIFELKLDLGVVGGELEADFVDELGCHREVWPPLQVLVPLVLQFVLASLVKLNHHVSDVLGKRLIFDILNGGLLELVCHDSERFWLGRVSDLLHEVVAEGILHPRVLQENGLGTDVKHAVVALD